MFKYFIRSIGIMFFINLGNFHYVTLHLIPYVNDVNNVIKISCDKSKIFKYYDSVIDFDDLSDDEIGVCSFGKNVFTITFDRKFWQVATEAERFQLVMHEETHCLLHQMHVDKKDNFMYPVFTDIPREKIIKQLKEFCK